MQVIKGGVEKPQRPSPMPILWVRERVCVCGSESLRVVRAQGRIYGRHNAKDKTNVYKYLPDRMPEKTAKQHW